MTIAAVREHAWFDGFDFGALERRDAVGAPIPWVPPIGGEMDFHHFDEYSRDEEAYEPYFGDSAWSAAFS